MNKNYRSTYAKHIEEFISFKQKLGYKFERESFYLNDIDKHAFKASQTNPGIAKEFVEVYSKQRLNESPSNRYTRISILAQLSSYISNLGIESYIPRLPSFPKNTFIPYIFSQKEIEKIFKACDELVLKIYHADTVLFSVPLILRFLYSTGVRIGEAKVLNNNDVNLKDSYVKIRDSKNRKERIIPLNESLVTLCKEYVHYKSFLKFDKETSENFFVNLNGNQFGVAVNVWFRKCLEIAGIKSIGLKQNPRIHDLRHTFAVTSLAKMAESGIDLYASLPILSTYLGHQSISATNHYVRLTASIYPNLIGDLDQFYLDVFPNFENYENN